MATLKEAIYDILHTDGQSADAGTIGALCGYDATSKPRVVYYQYAPEMLDTPFVTYRIAAETGRFPHSFFFDVVVWGGDFRAIVDRAYDLLNERLQVTATDWQIKGILYESSGPEIWDENLKCYYQRARYQIVTIRL